MGDPRQIRRKYNTPKHPWQEERLEKEKDILGDYSLKNKKEIWKMQAVLKRYTNQAKKLANIRTEQSRKEKEQLISKLFKMGMMKKDADIDDVLGLTIQNILDRRLQTLVYKLNMANTMKQARQFIVHGHIFVGSNKISIPSYLVPANEEPHIKFKENSNLIGKFGKKDEKEKKIKNVEVKKEEKKTEEKKDEKPKKEEKIKIKKTAKKKEVKDNDKG